MRRVVKVGGNRDSRRCSGGRESERTARMAVVGDQKLRGERDATMCATHAADS
jgi:hypothetical protein